MDDTRDGRIGVGLRIYRDRKSLRCARNHESYWDNRGHTGAASDGGPQGSYRGNTGVGYFRHSVYCGLPDREERYFLISRQAPRSKLFSYATLFLSIFQDERGILAEPAELL